MRGAYREFFIRGELSRTIKFFQIEIRQANRSHKFLTTQFFRLCSDIQAVSCCSDFRRKRNIYARCDFFIHSIFADRINSSQQFFCTLLKILAF